MREKFIEIHGRKYRIDAKQSSFEKKWVWCAYRLVRGSYIKIPCWTRAEQAKFPKSVARDAQQFTNELNSLRGAEVI